MTRLYTDEVELYDIAFTWDLEDEVSWLLERFGPSCMTVLEPGSGTGRMLEALTAATVAALTVYDMAKAIDKSMVIAEVRLVEKTKQ